ncbi:MAG TPA: RtcB family protein [Aggregatilinea sp.]|uniref:RtcB family protein n=1 Tax=Aggregatilinea sp. TaxID=2806333 RepID=UPI002D05ACDC|nr:RtcB family protein [Aggregatilinea sp.]HML22925.1 RtcB family protein [Aggregatilinea sp.]
MNGQTLIDLGFQPGRAVGLALKVAADAEAQGTPEADILAALADVLRAPAEYTDHPVYGAVAATVMTDTDYNARKSTDSPVDAIPYKVWGRDGIESDALDQMKRAAKLPISVRGALMPDAHPGYGLPIGGVLATDNAVIPYAVGVDIACRMRLTVFDASPHILTQKRERFRTVLEEQTRFGAGSTWSIPREHEVMDDPLWDEHPAARLFKDVAWHQLGTSGSGNHFVEFGALVVNSEIPSPLGTIAPGTYLALLSHSGSRRFGLEMANRYTRIAMQLHETLPKEYQHLAWLGLDHSAGAEYWAAMTLAGRYASANHAIIHQQIAEAIGFPVVGGVENHHNFAWQETFDGQDVIVHRKGATPAGTGVLGVIPGSMGAPGYVVRGLGSAEALNSASHGAGRRLSRKRAIEKFDWDSVRRYLKEQNVELISAGLDEAPGAYKDIRKVMADQADLVEALAEFQPRLVKMDGDSPDRRTERQPGKDRQKKGRRR